MSFGQRQYLAKNLVATQVAQLGTGVGTLHTIVVNRTGNQPLVIIDGAGGTTIGVIGTLKSSVAEGTYLYDCCFGSGLRVNVQSDSDITVTFSVGA